MILAYIAYVKKDPTTVTGNGNGPLFTKPMDVLPQDLEAVRFGIKLF